MKHSIRAILIGLMLALTLPQIASASSTVLERAVKIISTMESSVNYGSVANDTNGSPSVGILQWNNTRAVDLLKKIMADDADTAKSLLGNKLYKELSEGDSYAWSDKQLTDAQKKAVGKLLKTDVGIACQEEQATYDVLTYINRARSLGIVDANVLVYYADIAHQTGLGGARKYATKAAENAGGFEKITLKTLYKVAVDMNPNAKTRRKRVYEALANDPAKDDGAPPEAVMIDPAGVKTLTRNNDALLYARISPSDSSADITWSTSDPEIVEVYGGLITARRIGSATITASAQNGQTNSITVVVAPVHAGHAPAGAELQ